MKQSLEQIVKEARNFKFTNPIMDVQGYSQEPALSIANEVIKTMLSQPCRCFKFPLKEAKVNNG